MATTTKPTNPQDATGRAAEQAAKKVAKEAAARAEEISLATAVEKEIDATGVFDSRSDAPILLDEVETVGTALRNNGEQMVDIRVHYDIEDMTYGVSNGAPANHTFKAGRTYRVPLHLAQYLEGLGYIWTAA